MRIKRHKLKWDSSFFLVLELMIDLLIVLLSFSLSLFIVLDISPSNLLLLFSTETGYMITCFTLITTYLILNRVYGISIIKRSFMSVILRIFLSLVISKFLLFILIFTNVINNFPILTIPIMFILEIILFIVIKYVSFSFLKRVNINNSIIIGPRDDVELLAKKLLYCDNKYILLKYLVYDDFLNEETYKVFSYIDKVDYVYLTENLSEIKKDIIISYCLKNKKSFFLVPKLYELTINKAKILTLSDKLLYKVNSIGLTLEQRFFKRAFDLIVSIFILILSLPVMLLVALAIKIQDGGSILFKQERITRNNKKFTLYKFRTMIPDAEKSTGPVLATEHDTRITKVGRFLRATRIDELPQLINIIKGDMSIVGPRPEREFFIKQFIELNEDYQYRLNVKAGVTGLAQSLGTYHSSYNEKLRFDIYYITNYSFLNDITIILQTIRSIFDPKSAKGLSADTSLKKELEAEGYYLHKTNEENIKIVVKK